MPLDRFFIGELNSGLQTNLRPFAIADDAYPELNNAYVFRGRVRKRFGSRLMNNGVSDSVAQLYSRLGVNLGNTPGPLNLPNPNPAIVIGQIFSVGDDIFTVDQLGAGVNILSTNPAITATINSVAIPNTITFVGAPAGTAVYWYPTRPVMGLISRETSTVNDEPVIAFDTTYSYSYILGRWERIVGGNDTWSGNDSQFFWGSNWTGATSNTILLFVTNFKAADGVRYFDGANWTTFQPQYTANVADVIKTAKIVVPFKDRLLFFNTIEGAANTPFNNRVRFSRNGNPIDPVQSFREDIPGRGGYLDASTKEAIITVEFLRDKLIVYFERSTWELVYTANEILPFRWQQINTELGVESTFSIIPFDKVAIGVGQVGVHACNGINVERIDQKIPNTVFNISNVSQGLDRVYGIRDYFTELLYWTYPVEDTDAIYPRKILVYNYVTGSWAFNDDSITCFGYFQPADGVTWGTSSKTWGESIEVWNSPTLNAKFRNVLAGNQEGFVFIVDSDNSRNSQSLSITTISNTGRFYVLNHNLVNGDFVLIENAQGNTNYNDQIFQVSQVHNVHEFTIIGIDGTGYTGGGTLARVSRIDILTKQFNFYAKTGRNATISRAEFLVDQAPNPAGITVSYYASTSNINLRTDGLANNSIVGTSVLDTYPYALYPLEASQASYWHPIYIQCEGQYVQLRLYLSDEQMVNYTTALSDFELNGMIFYATPTGQLR